MVGSLASLTNGFLGPSGAYGMTSATLGLLTLAASLPIRCRRNGTMVRAHSSIVLRIRTYYCYEDKINRGVGRVLSSNTLQDILA